MKKIICPISNEKIEEASVRITGFLIVILLTTSIWYGTRVLMGLVVLDYFSRAFTNWPAGPITWLAQRLSYLLTRTFKFIDKAPKIFAARVGFLFAICGLALSFTAPMASNIVLVTLALFAGLESIFNLCMGCIVYTHVVLRIYK